VEIYDDDGNLLQATFHVEWSDGSPTVLFESRNAGRYPRNSEYNPGLELVLKRLGIGGATLVRVDVESSQAMLLANESERQLTIDEAPYPIDLGRWPDFRQLRVGLGRGAARVAKAPTAKPESSGNSQKRVRLRLGFPESTPVTTRWLTELISRRPPDVPERDTVVIRATDGVPGQRPSFLRAAGQGRSQDARRNRAVELFAMAIATAHFEDQGWRVEDVSNQPYGYDLFCNRAGEHLHVEVKGTTGAGESVILTRNEVEQAHENPERSVLFVVHGVDVKDNDGEWVCSGGSTRVLVGWDPRARGELRPSQYDYRLPPDSEE
jgi:hypothetical protein